MSEHSHDYMLLVSVIIFNRAKLTPADLATEVQEI